VDVEAAKEDRWQATIAALAADDFPASAAVV